MAGFMRVQRGGGLALEVARVIERVYVRMMSRPTTATANMTCMWFVIQ
jgi:hypothetical protein